MNSKIVGLFLVFILSIVISVGSGYFVDYQVKKFDEFKKEAYAFDTLSKRWGNKQISKNVIDEIANSAGNDLFSVSVTKREQTPDSYILGLMVLNGDELDSVVSKVLNQPIAIKRFEIINNDIGYLVLLEVYV